MTFKFNVTVESSYYYLLKYKKKFLGSYDPRDNSSYYSYKTVEKQFLSIEEVNKFIRENKHDEIHKVESLWYIEDASDKLKDI